MNFIKTLQLILFIAISTTAFSQKQDPEIYLPSNNGNWEKAKQQESNWNAFALKELIGYAENQNSSGLLILANGKILVEEYWIEKKDLHFEDVASIQKSVISLLCGIAISQRILDINSSVNKYIKSGWSNSDLKNENKILVKHLLSMSSGLDESLNFKYLPGEKWSYNTTAYSRLITILETITAKDIKVLTQEWLTKPIGIKDSKWIKRQGNYDNPHGYKANLRDLGRLGLLILNNGYWDGENIIKNKDYLKEAFQPSQEMNKKYGYLFWLNTELKYHSDCPDDMIIMVGAGNRNVYVFPSTNVVVVRLGRRAEKGFHNKILDLIIESMPN
ncbi:serine hydrolase domain-containing protein [Algibacter aquimarinus]|uniref:Beta-lactamase-related domain-containing protein n=1 Tax=Algibacter aquimarinus TaxID=1136748 RepID=A0ABP9HPB5_9FLAO